MREISFFEGRLCLAVQLQKNRNFYLVVPFCLASLRLRGLFGTKKKKKNAFLILRFNIC
jgi:hypothetical protein